MIYNKLNNLILQIIQKKKNINNHKNNNLLVNKIVVKYKHNKLKIQLQIIFNNTFKMMKI